MYSPGCNVKLLFTLALLTLLLPTCLVSTLREQRTYLEVSYIASSAKAYFIRLYIYIYFVLMSHFDGLVKTGIKSNWALD